MVLDQVLDAIIGPAAFTPARLTPPRVRQVIKADRSLYALLRHHPSVEPVEGVERTIRSSWDWKRFGSPDGLLTAACR